MTYKKKLLALTLGMLLMMVCAITAMADPIAPTNLQWSMPGVLQYEVPANQTGTYYFETYELQATGDWKSMAKHTSGISDWHMRTAARSASGNAILTHSFTSTISARGIDKTMMVRVKYSPVQGDNDFSTGAVSDYSPVYTYHVPQQKLTAPRDIRWSPDKANTLIWTSDPGVDTVMILLYIDGQQRKSIATPHLKVGSNEFDLTNFLNQAYQEFNPAEHHYSYGLQSFSDQIEVWAVSDIVPFE